MKRILAIALAATLCLTLATTAMAADPVRPFGGTATSTDSYGPPTCPGASWQFFSSGPGHFTHLGVVTMDVTHCTWIDSPTTGHFGPGTATLTAANGDMLTLSQWGTFETVMTSHGLFGFVDIEWEVAGGTGRLEDASGEGAGSVVGNIGAGTSAATYWGTIAY